jgi:hypothetical protein
MRVICLFLLLIVLAAVVVRISLCEITGGRGSFSHVGRF